MTRYWYTATSDFELGLVHRGMISLNREKSYDKRILIIQDLSILQLTPAIDQRKFVIGVKYSSRYIKMKKNIQEVRFSLQAEPFE